MSLAQTHTLRSFSLLVIPPSPDRIPMQGGFLMDLSELNLSGWATLVQDIVTGMQVLPPNLGCDMVLPAVALLQLLETLTGLGFCHYCCHLGSRCTCMGAYQPAPPQSWSQIVEQTPRYGVTASSGGMTTPSTTVAGMSGYVAPPPGLTLPDFPSWRLPPPEAPPSRGLPAAPQGLPGVGRSLMMRGAAERNTQAQMAQGPSGLAQWARHSPHWHCTHPKWHRLSTNHYLGGQQHCTNRWYNCQGSPQGGELLWTPPQIKLPLWVAQVHRTVGDLQLEGGEMVADLSVAPGGCRRRLVCSHCVRRAICPPGQRQVFHHQWHLKGPCLSGEVSLRPPTMILHNWQQIFTAQGERRTLSMCSGSTTNTMLPPLRRQSG